MSSLIDMALMRRRRKELFRIQLLCSERHSCHFIHELIGGICFGIRIRISNIKFNLLSLDRIFLADKLKLKDHFTFLI